MKLLISAIFSLLSISANADVGALFPGESAWLFIQGNNTDALNLYEAMNVTPDVTSNNLKKRIAFQTTPENPIFDLSCDKSPLTEDAACIIKFTPAGTAINKDQKTILMGINNRISANKMATLFKQISSTPYQGEVFLSEDGKLRIWITFNRDGDVVAFTIKYN